MRQITRRQLLKDLGLLAPAVLFGCTSGGGGGTSSNGPSPSANASLQAVPWPGAEALFRNDPAWLGGDGVYSVDLGQGRVVYLFSDSFIATSPRRVRTESVIVRNSVAIQSGYDPTTATIKFFWGQQDGAPAPLFRHPDPARWYWLAHGSRIGSQLVVFLTETTSSSGGLGFQGTGWAAAIIDNADADPSEWHITLLPTRMDFGLSVGKSVLQAQGYVYAYATPILLPGPVYLVRWPLATAISTSLAGGEWYTSTGWSSQGAAPVSLMGNGQAEFNLYPDGSLAPFVLFQTDRFGQASIAYRTARDLTGSWSDVVAFYAPPEATRPNVLIYAAKMHPMLVNPNAEFVVSYSTNHTDFQTLLTDSSLYYPRFIQVTRGPHA